MGVVLGQLAAFNLLGEALAVRLFVVGQLVLDAVDAALRLFQFLVGPKDLLGVGEEVAVVVEAVGLLRIPAGGDVEPLNLALVAVLLDLLHLAGNLDPDLAQLLLLQEELFLVGVLDVLGVVAGGLGIHAWFLGLGVSRDSR